MRRATALLALVLAGCAGDEPPPERLLRVDPQEAVLRLSDLPRGYRHGDDSACGPASATEGDWPRLQPLFANERPEACVVEFGWAWSDAPDGPRGVTSAVYVFRDFAGARTAFDARSELARFTGSLDVRDRAEVGLGHEAELARGDGLNDPASAVVWRVGNVVAIVVAEPADDDAARRLAERQQARIEDPKPLALADIVGDPELELEDPALTMPVYWLGRRFEPGGGLPPLELAAVHAGAGRGEQGAELDYDARRPRTLGVKLLVWQPARWERWKQSRVGRLIWDSPCATKTMIALERGRAEIFTGHGTRRPLERPCPQRPPDRRIAHVYVGGVVVSVNVPLCYPCAELFAELEAPYETAAGMEAVVRGLRPRAEPS